MQFTIYQIPLLLTSIISVALICLILNRKRVVGGKYLILFLTSVFIWSLSDFFDLLCTNLSDKLFWENVSYFGVATFGVFLLLFILEYTGKENYINRFIYLLFLIPVITIILVWTNEYHHLLRQTIYIETISGVLAFGKVYGIWFWILFFYNYCLILITFILVFYALNTPHYIYRKQGILFFIGIFLPWISNFIYVFRIMAFPIDMTSVSFIFTGLALFWGITREQLLDIVPTAYTAVFNEIPDGVIVLGGTNQIVDFNPAAELILNVKASNIRGKNFSELITEWKEMKDVFKSHVSEDYYRSTISNHDKYYDVIFKKIYSKKGLFVGQLIVLRDISKRIKMEIKLKESNKQIEDLNETLQVINKILRHDLLNKLTIMKTSLLLYEEKNDKLLFDKLNRSVDSGIDLIFRIRELESFLSSKGDLTNIDIRKTVEEISKNISIPINITGNANALADQALFSVLENIMRNAVIHSKTDRVDVDISSKDKSCQIKIADYGKGIPEPIKENIFEEGISFGDSKGSGLGLYIVKKTIERYGGSIVVEDNIPQGTIFTIKLKCLNN
ncbi:MAG TPA: histidine kinase N-terminal 7TM domain-containing protein [Methanofastidiosum sp.]|nr:histidine kinase N-terminal 7TM domain-containing protein [Methanofastidiosum sp.]HRS24977.1 histidine kinase N-terminal 7TM domain-containing protein [Methanofastidiosum sp.]